MYPYYNVNQQYTENPIGPLTPSFFPPGTDPYLVACFQAVDRDRSGFIDDKDCRPRFRVTITGSALELFVCSSPCSQATTVVSSVENDGTLRYTNLFDMMVDSVYAALEKVNASEVKVVVSETGWPSAGDTAATLENAKTYNQNLINHVARKKGTPRRPGKVVETYLFAMFNEDQKPGDTTEQHFGLYHPDMTEVYHVDFPS